MGEQNKGKILILDDDEDILVTTRILLKRYFPVIRTLSEPGQLMKVLEEESFDVVLLDMNFSAGSTTGKEGLDCLRKIMKVRPDISVVLMTAYADINLAVEGIRQGAIDFMVKPWENEKFLATIMTAFQLCRKKKEINHLKTSQKVLISDLEQSFSEIIGASKRMKELLGMISKIAPTDVNVLILGENGTGKEILARAIHKASLRRNELFIRVDLGSIPETLFESELFGHVKGAFTDARDDRTGRFEVASGGTLFLDEIGNLSLPLQSKLLTAVQSREIYRVGSSKPIPIDIRLISATNMPLYDMVEEKKFREDLLYRINTVELKIPPLRERDKDIPLLVNHFIRLYGQKYQKKYLQPAPAALKKLMKYNWPGNIRELEHVVERAMILGEDKVLKPADFVLSESRSRKNTDQIINLPELEKNAIGLALDKHRGNLSKASMDLGLGRTTLYRKMKKYGIV